MEPGGIKTDIWEDLDGDLQRRRGSRFDAAYRRSSTGIRYTQAFMGDSEQVAGVVVRAMTTRLPRERYLVGLDALAATTASRMTPTFVSDQVTRAGLGLMSGRSTRH